MENERRSEMRDRTKLKVEQGRLCIEKMLSRDFSSPKGFSLIELILAVSIVLVIGTMSTAYAARFLTQNGVDNTTDQFVSSIRKAQMNAMMSKQNSDWGVYYASRTITLYRGNSYATRVAGFDERYSVLANVTVSGITDLNFDRISGLPNTTPTITISGNGKTSTITVNSQGVVNR